MITFSEALEKIVSNAVINDTEHIELHNTLNRVLAEDVFYDIDLPPFNKSAMDGFACRKQDLANELTIIETIYAGKQPENSIGENQCARIMTGAVVPEGADIVFMFEMSEEYGDNKVKCTNLKSSTNICYVGEDVKTGDIALPANTLIKPKHIPILAGAGIHNPNVYKQPVVSVFSTGTELVEPNEKPLPHQIRNSNSSMLMAQLEEIGIAGNYRGIIKDDAQETEDKLTAAINESDITIMSGGVSTGDFDFIPRTLIKLGFETIVHESAVQPGRPIVFARKGNKYCFGCAGNPVSSFIQFDNYIKPFIFATMNFGHTANIASAVFTDNFKRKKTNRMLFIPGVLNKTDNTVGLVKYNGSAHIHALVEANCLIEIPLGAFEVNKGETVNVRQI